MFAPFNEYLARAVLIERLRRAEEDRRHHRAVRRPCA